VLLDHRCSRLAGLDETVVIPGVNALALYAFSSRLASTLGTIRLLDDGRSVSLQT
jgi:hypothetical protein